MNKDKDYVTIRVPEYKKVSDRACHVRPFDDGQRKAWTSLEIKFIRDGQEMMRSFGIPHDSNVPIVFFEAMTVLLGEGQVDLKSVTQFSGK